MQQYGVYGDADHDKKSLKRQCEQGFKIAVADVAPLAVGEGGERYRGDRNCQVNLNHPAVYNEENAEREVKGTSNLAMLVEI